MGQASSCIRAATLNYSGIFVSPFEFYAMDNWQELERIGIIFQENLRQKYPFIKQKVNKLIDQEIENKKKEDEEKKGGKIKDEKPDKKKLPDSYIRKKFDWKIGDQDKNHKEPRLSPLYLQKKNYPTQPNAKETYLKDFFYAGITQDHKLMNQKEFEKNWQHKIDKYLEQKGANGFGQLKNTLCEQFDFLCYRSIIEYLYNIRENSDRLFKQEDASKINKNQHEGQNIIPFEFIVTKINDSNNSKELVQIYRDFMARYFIRIDEDVKITMTLKYLFSQWDMDIICLQEVNQQFREKLIRQPQEKYFVFGPNNEKEKDQCFLLIKKNSSLVPQYFRQYYQQERKSIDTFKNAVKPVIGSFQKFKLLNNDQTQNFLNAVETHFGQNKRGIFKKKMDEKDQKKKFSQKSEQQQKQIFEKFSKQSKLQLLSPLQNQPHQWIQTWLNDKYKQFFLNYWKKQIESMTEKDKEIAEPFNKSLDKKGLFAWTEGFILTRFHFSKKELQKHHQPNKRQIIIGSFHLTSKTPKNRMQVQILGLLIHYLVVIRQYDIILGGDFNSYIFNGEKDKKQGLFTVLKKYYKDSSAEMKKILDLQKNLFVFPKHQKIYTTKKKRTILQVQVNKSNEFAQKCVDQIITNLNIDFDNCYTGVVSGLESGKNENQQFLPTSGHPYDHFVVEAKLRPNPIQQQRQ